MNYCVWLSILWLLLPDTQQGWIIFKNSHLILPLKSSDTPDVSLFPLLLYTHYQINFLPWAMKCVQLKNVTWTGQYETIWWITSPISHIYLWLKKTTSGGYVVMDAWRVRDKWRIAWLETNMWVICLRKCDKMRDNWEKKLLSLSPIYIYCNSG
jgi:hypothetical protein